MFRFARPANICIRSFSQKAAEPLPKKVHGITGRYAGAVYNAANKAGNLEKVESELLAFNATLTKAPQFASFIDNPVIPREEKAAKISEVIGEGKFTDITKNLLVVLAANGRIRDITKVVNTYSELMEARRGNVKATIVSAEALQKKSIEAVEAAVFDMLGKKKKIEYTYKEDPNILGGLQVIIGDTILDLSVAQRLTELNSALEGSTA